MPQTPDTVDPRTEMYPTESLDMLRTLWLAQNAWPQSSMQGAGSTGVMVTAPGHELSRERKSKGL